MALSFTDDLLADSIPPPLRRGIGARVGVTINKQDYY